MADKDKEKGGAVVAKGGAQLPAFMQEHVGKGTENLRASDAEMPRIALLQGLSSELETYDGLKAGMFWHTLAEKPLGKVGEAIPVTPIYIAYRYVLWNPRHAGGGILARADDGVHWSPPEGKFQVKLYKDRNDMGEWTLAPTVAQSRLDQWGTYDPKDPKSQPAATLCYTTVLGFPTMPELGYAVAMLQRTSVGVARKLIGKLKMSRAPCYGMIFNMSSFDDNRNGNDFKNWQFTAAGFVEDEATFQKNAEMHEQFVKMGVQIRDLENAQEDGTPAASPQDVKVTGNEKY